MKSAITLIAVLIFAPAAWANTGSDAPKAGCDILKPDPYLNVGPGTTQAVVDMTMFGKGLSAANCGKSIKKADADDEDSQTEAQVAELKTYQIGRGTALPQFEKFGPGQLRDFGWALQQKPVVVPVEVPATELGAVGSEK